MERFLAANGVELTRADTKAAVLLAFTGAVLGVFISVTRSATAGQAPHDGSVRLLWWTAVISALLAIGCFVCAIVPRRRGGRRQGPAVPGYFEHITPELADARLSRAFERIGQDPTGPLTASLARTSEIIRAKYRWIETGTVLLLVALPQFTVVLRPA
ncbi:Pycsar system effector family protein [Streptomyces caniferus]|uniref:Pycsar system effector family protein n=1 Tax=Streptomyces caniferus TaxID=285557 RepID=UPI00382523AD